jgi:hypothetical protein
MGNPPNGILRGFGADGAAKPRQGQVQRGNTSRQLHAGACGKRACVLSMAGEALYGAGSEMELAMRIIQAAGLAAIGAMLALAPARADWVPPFKGNDTGGIIAYSLTSTTDIRTLAINHCASYGKVVKFLAVEPHYGGYISFACRWVPYDRATVRAAY